MFSVESKKGKKEEKKEENGQRWNKKDFKNNLFFFLTILFLRELFVRVLVKKKSPEGLLRLKYLE